MSGPRDPEYLAQLAEDEREDQLAEERARWSAEDRLDDERDALL